MVFLLISFTFCSVGGSHRQCSCNRNKYRLFICVVVNSLSQLIFIFPLFLGMMMNANEFKKKEI